MLFFCTANTTDLSCIDWLITRVEELENTNKTLDMNWGIAATKLHEAREDTQVLYDALIPFAMAAGADQPSRVITLEHLSRAEKAISSVRIENLLSGRRER